MNIDKEDHDTDDENNDSNVDNNDDYNDDNDDDNTVVMTIVTIAITAMTTMWRWSVYITLLLIITSLVYYFNTQATPQFLNSNNVPFPGSIPKFVWANYGFSLLVFYCAREISFLRVRPFSTPTKTKS